MINYSLKHYFNFNKKNIQILNKKFGNLLKKKYKFQKRVKISLKNFDYNRGVLNKRIEVSYFNTLKIKPKNQIFNSKNLSVPVWFKNESYFNINDLLFFVKKELILTKLVRKRQFFFIVKDLTFGINQNILTLLKNNNPLQNKLFKTNNYFAVEHKKFSLFYSKYISSLFFSQLDFSAPVVNNSNTAYVLVLKKFLPIYNDILYAKLLNKKQIAYIKKNEIISLFYAISFINRKWIASNKNYKNFKTFTFSFNNLIKQSKIKAILNGHYLLGKKNLFLTFLNGTKNPSLYLWKKNNSFFPKAHYNLKKKNNKRFFALPEQRLILGEDFGKFNIIKRNKIRNLVSKHLLYILIRLEEKIDFYSSNVKTQNLALELTKLYNLINYLIQQKLDKKASTSLILANINEILKIKTDDWKFIGLRAINVWLKDNLNSLTNKNKTEKFFENIWKKIKDSKTSVKRKRRAPKNFIFYNATRNRNFFGNQIKQKKQLWQKRNSYSQMSARKIFINEKIKITNQYTHLHNVKDALSVITKRKVKIFFINALSLSKYAFNYEREIDDRAKRSPTIFLQNIDRDMINKFKYVAVYIKDLIRVCFIGMFLKKATFMAKFIAFQIAKLPKNRKETSFIRFIIKVVKTFAAERQEILGLRIKFRGRVNRWRRTKSIIGERGIIPLHTINNRIEFGSAQAVNKKGAIGVRIWIRYKLSFSTLIKESTLKYFAYSKRLKIKKKLPNLIPFTRVK